MGQILLQLLICLTTFFQDNLGKADTRKVNHSGFYWSKRWWGGSGISWTICNAFAPCQCLTTRILQARCPSCSPTNSVKALKTHGTDSDSE